MSMTSAIDQKLTRKMEAAFSSTQDRKNAVHLTAAAGAAIVAMLPIGLDVCALRIAECVMIMCIADSYGEKLTRSAAKGLMLSSFAKTAGELAAIAALQASSFTSLINPAISFSLRCGLVVALIETIGKLAIAYYEDPDGIGHKLCQGAEIVGLGADVARCAGMLCESAGTMIAGEASAVNGASESAAVSSMLSFTGREGYSYGHSESYWKEQAAKALTEDRKAGYDYAMKRLKEAIADRLKDAKA